MGSLLEKFGDHCIKRHQISSTETAVLTIFKVCFSLKSAENTKTGMFGTNLMIAAPFSGPWSALTSIEKCSFVLLNTGTRNLCPQCGAMDSERQTCTCKLMEAKSIAVRTAYPS